MLENRKIGPAAQSALMALAIWVQMPSCLVAAKPGPEDPPERTLDEIAAILERWWTSIETLRFTWTEANQPERWYYEKEGQANWADGVNPDRPTIIRAPEWAQTATGKFY